MTVLSQRTCSLFSTEARNGLMPSNLEYQQLPNITREYSLFPKIQNIALRAYKTHSVQSKPPRKPISQAKFLFQPIFFQPQMIHVTFPTLIPIQVQIVPINQESKEQNFARHFTLLCEDYALGKTCRTNRCTFAHGEERQIKVEVKPSHKICKAWQNGFCRYGINCRNMHVYLPKYKTKLCKPFMKNKKCRDGDHCTFAHGKDEQRIQQL
ncbi:MAG: hypothetical protein COT84_01595 [Chlamydiae bacterium CG10_big_fil_rev_8_21_14_0_10_35_9]|nr:MAG: hypothetical protein COT84_01595 [Chlamydiae bacterium CG10_big_fil_rev_8_21_14_0_10_35_9]